MVKWDKTATKSHLYAADSALQQAKELLRLANDLKYSAMNKQHYGVSCDKLAEIGVMLGVLIEDVKTGSGSKGKITKEKLQKSVKSWTGHASHADSYNLQKKIITLAARADEEAAAKAA